MATKRIRKNKRKTLRRKRVGGTNQPESSAARHQRYMNEEHGIKKALGQNIEVEKYSEKGIKETIERRYGKNLYNEHKELYENFIGQYKLIMGKKYIFIFEGNMFEGIWDGVRFSVLNPGSGSKYVSGSRVTKVYESTN